MGVHSTQRNESYHVVVKQKLHRHLLIGKAIHAIVEKTADLGRKYDVEINRNRRSSPQLMDRRAFALAGQKLTHYAIELTMRELSAAKRLANDVAEGLVLDFEPKTECIKGCQGPLQYGLPCWH